MPKEKIRDVSKLDSPNSLYQVVRRIEDFDEADAIQTQVTDKYGDVSLRLTLNIV
jgi:hypothetical protein